MSTPRRTLAAVVFLTATSVCQIAAQRPALEALPPVVIDQLAEGDRAQVAAARERLDALLDAPEPEAASLAQAYGEAGSLYLLYDFVDAATVCFVNARRLGDDRFAWTYYLAVAHSREGRLPEAESALEEASAKKPDDLATWLRLGAARADRGDWAGAAEAFETALALDDSVAAAHHGLGRVALAGGDTEGAIGRFERALVLQPSATTLHHALGLAWRERGDLEKARAHLIQNRHDPVRFSDPLVERLTVSISAARDHVRAGTQALEAGDLETALAFFQLAVEKDPSDALAHYNLGRARLETGERDAAIARFRTVLDLDPAYRDAHVNLALALAEGGRLAEAEPHFARAAELDPLDLDARRSWAVALDQLGRSDRSRAVLEAILEAPGLTSEPAAAAHADLGRLAERAGDGGRAIEHFDAAVDRAPGVVEHRRRLAAALGRAGRFDQAAEHLLVVVEQAPEDVESRFGAAMALLFAQRFQAARDLLEDGLRDQTDALPLRHMLARILATAPDDELRDGPRAVRLAQQVFRTAQSIDHGETLAMALAEAGDFAGAIVWQERVLEQARRAGRNQAIGRIERRLARYRAGDAVRNPWEGG